MIWVDGERLSIEQSAERILAEYPHTARGLVDISVCSWFEHRTSESGSNDQINELDRIFGPWMRARQGKSPVVKK